MEGGVWILPIWFVRGDVCGGGAYGVYGLGLPGFTTGYQQLGQGYQQESP